MVTLKRDENTENRFGGYTTRLNSRLDTNERFAKYATNETFESEATDSENFLWQELRRTENARAATSFTPNKEIFENHAAVVQKQKATLSAKGKVVLVLYAILAVTLTVLIVINSLSIASYNTQIEALEQELQNAQMLLNEDKAMIESYKNVNMSLASEYGMVKSEVSGTFPVVYPIVEDSTVMNTNWFDKLCDSVSGFFGG